MSEPVRREFCGAKCTDGSTCRRKAGSNTDHPGYGTCSIHYGNTPSHKRMVAFAIADEVKANYGLPIEVDPHTALLEELARTNGHVAWLGHLVGEMDRGELTYLNAVGVEDTSALIKLYQQERGHLVKSAKTAIDAGVQEREISLAERQADIVAAVITGTLRELEVDVTPEVQTIIRRQLMTVSQSAETA